ncbi:protein-glucosylgalactosylhydroxylysine glucosidase-like isoform X1 [Mytilus galloprovincialis]|uniref:protein-glucosylgalactosylhydroxylysine glucosidase-like isoform X1 n=1 Tax=Mytilus galloprovincialis TaxID=29158 RepID=UPI003F7C8017
MGEFVISICFFLFQCLIAVDSSIYSPCDSEDVWCLVSSSLPDEKFMPPIGNGHIATNVLSDTIYMNGFYNGYREDSHRARLQATSAVDVQFNDGRDSRYYALDMFNGIFYQKIYHPTQNTSITIMYFSHRKYDTLLVTHVSVQQILPTNISFICSKGGLSQDIGNFSEVKVDNSTTYWSGENKRPETDDLEPMRFHHVWTNKVNVSEDFINGSYRSNWISITSIGTDKEEVFSLYRKALEMTHDNLVNQHKQEWNRIWKKGHIEIHGDDKELQRNIHAAFYNILSSLPQKQNVHNPFIGLSPGGLSRGGKINPNKTGGPSNDYAGHVFWDMDTWIMPPIMMFHPNLARLMINSRIRVLDTAKENAKGTGYLGARFPWEQAVTGIETCPWDLASKYQVHVTADVSYALRQYLYVSSKDAAIEMLTNGGSSLALEIAKFWESRVNKTDDRNDILGVMGPDEYHYNINNSVFTNYNAKLSLMLPSFLDNNYKGIDLKNKIEIAKYKETANKLKILFDERTRFHPQFEGFRLKDKIKQSDVVLLGFPLLMPMDPEIRRNDLVSYEKMTDQFGPDTGTWSMHTVGWLELQDEHKAQEMFKMLLRNINGPFKVFSEKPSNSPDGPRCVNFITGAGGLLQAVIFGYGGIRIRESQLDLNPHLLPGVNSWAMKGLKYKGFEFDVSVNQSDIQVTLISGYDGQSVLTIQSSSKKEMNTQIGMTNTFKRGKLVFDVKDFPNRTPATGVNSASDIDKCVGFETTLLFFIVTCYHILS